MLATDLEIYQDQCEVQNAIAHHQFNVISPIPHTTKAYAYGRSTPEKSR